MKIEDITGWPPSKYDSAEKSKEDCGNQHPEPFVLQSACFIPGTTPTTGDLVLVVIDTRTGEECTARLRITNAELGRRMALALSECKGMPLKDAGDLEINHQP